MRYCCAVLVLILQSCFGYSQSLEGEWNGLLDVGATKLRLVIHIVEQDGKLTATLDSPDQGAFGVTSSIRKVQDSIFINSVGGIVMKGKVKSETSIDAVFQQGGMKIPLLLNKGNASIAPVKTVNRPQEPQAPYAYNSQEVSFLNKDGLQFAGTLTSPNTKGKYPAVLLLTGSGPQNRDEELFGHKPFKVLADYLTKNGIVVLRYDERGVGKSAGSFETSTIADFSKDAADALSFLKKQEMVDINKIGIIGHSEGGLIATLLAAQALPNLSYMVSLAGPAISIDQLMVEQLYAVGKAEGMSEKDLAAARKINARNFAIAKSNMNTADAYAALLKNMGLSNTAQNDYLRQELMSMLAPTQRYFYRIEAEKYLSKIYIPVFAAFGTKDIQVPSTINLKSLHDGLQPNSKTVLKEYEGLNHLFQQAKTGRIVEYAQIEETFNPRVMKDIVDWIKGL